MNIWCLFAHPDDEFFCFNHLARLARRGDKVFCLYLTDGAARGCDAKKRLAESVRALRCAGIPEENVFELGLQLKVEDGNSHHHLESLYQAAHALIRSHGVDRLLIPTWEGGHVDHDAAHLLGIALSQELGIPTAVTEFPMYSTRGGPFFRVLEFFPQDHATAAHKLSLKEGLLQFSTIRFYKSQWKSFLGLGPEAFWRLVVQRQEFTRDIAPPYRDYRIPPHPRPMFYEKRFGISFEEFLTATRGFIEGRIACHSECSEESDLPLTRSFAQQRMTNSSVLVTDGHWRKSLAAVRGLGREGVSLAVAEASRLAPAMFSRYCRKRLINPSPSLHPDQFLKWLITLLSTRKFETLFPMEEDTLLLVARERDRISQYTSLLIPDLEQIELARNKDQFYKFAEGHQWPIPKTMSVEEALDSTLFPIIVKPSIGAGSKGVVSFDTPDALSSFAKGFRGDPAHLIFQEKVKGVGYGLTALLDNNSNVKASFVHRRIRDYPVSGGPSTLRMSIKNEAITTLGCAILKKLKWKGIAMLEFKVEEDSPKIHLIELNPRYPGSLALAIAAGVNFPYLQYQLAIGKELPKQTDYRENIMCRWLPGDILHFITNPNRLHLEPSFFKFCGKDLYYDDFSKDDPLPALGMLLSPLALMCDKALRTKARKT